MFDPSTPIRYAVAAVHELGHAAAAVCTGGRVREISIDLAGDGGHTITEGGVEVLILAAGPALPIALGALAVARGGRLRRAVGAGWCVFACWDVIQDQIWGGPLSDAAQLAARTGAPGWIWTLGWLAAGGALYGLWTRTQWSRTASWRGSRG